MLMDVCLTQKIRGMSLQCFLGQAVTLWNNAQWHLLQNVWKVQPLQLLCQQSEVAAISQHSVDPVMDVFSPASSGTKHAVECDLNRFHQ